ncbi:MAG: hypothetical protein KIT44_02995, partial [Opitutaceae bacterium]|nr:hypothetical protein [Opitutaceae bacterium]
LNLCYDVPMKLLSGHLLVMAVLLVVPDWRRLRDFFWHYRSTPAGDSPCIGLPLHLRRLAPALKAIVVVWVIGSTVYAQFR